MVRSALRKIEMRLDADLGLECRDRINRAPAFFRSELCLDYPGFGKHNALTPQGDDLAFAVAGDVLNLLGIRHQQHRAEHGLHPAFIARNLVTDFVVAI